VWGKDAPVGQHISNMQYLVLTNSWNRFSHNPSKNTGALFCTWIPGTLCTTVCTRSRSK
jgi:hypothetical protein